MKYRFFQIPALFPEVEAEPLNRIPVGSATRTNRPRQPRHPVGSAVRTMRGPQTRGLVSAAGSAVRTAPRGTAGLDCAVWTICRAVIGRRGCSGPHSGPYGGPTHPREQSTPQRPINGMAQRNAAPGG